MPTASEAKTIQAIDGGWGWVIVASVFVIRALSFAAVQSIGVAFDVLMQEFGCTRSDVGLMAGISLSLRYFLGPIVSLLQDKFGTRLVTLAGALTISIIFSLCAFASNIYYLYLIFGIIGGIGMSLIYLPTLIVISFYFKKRRSLATAIGGIGSYFGCFVFPYLIRFLIDTYGWRGAFFIVGAITLNSLPSAMLLRPSFSQAENKIGNVVQAVAETAKPRVGSQIVNYLKDFNLMFTIPAYSLFVLSNFLLMIVYFMPQLFVKEWGRNIGLPTQQTVILQSLVGPGNILGRPAIAYICDHFPQCRMFLFSGVLVISGIVMSIVMLFTDFYFMAFFVFQNAFFVGSTQSMLTPILADILPLEKLGSAFGVLLCAEGIATLVGPPLLVLFPTYALSFTCSGVILLASGLVLAGPLCAIRLGKYCAQRRKKVSQVPTEEDTEKGGN